MLWAHTVAALAFASMSPLTGQCRARPRAPPLVMALGDATRNSSKEGSGSAAAPGSSGSKQPGHDPSRRPPGQRFGQRLAFGGGALTVAGGAIAAVRRKRTLPVVLVHGILSNAGFMEEAADWAEHALGRGAYVRCIEVGNGDVDSISRPMEWQLTELAREIRADRRLRNGFNLIGHSQGSLLARAFVQRYDWPTVEVLVSWVGPQAGQFGVPSYEPLLGYVNRVTSGMWYTPELQSAKSGSRTLAFANYWRDPTKLEAYRANSGFLADINNERALKNASYATRLTRLKHFVLVYSRKDSIIQPSISSWFGYFKDNSTEVLEPLAHRAMYKEDWIGLRELDLSGRLHFAACDCHHVEVITASCKLQVWDQATARFLAPQRAASAMTPWLRPHLRGHYGSSSLPMGERFVPLPTPVERAAARAAAAAAAAAANAGRPSATPDYESYSARELRELESQLRREIADVEAAEAAAARRGQTAADAKAKADEAAARRAEGAAAAKARADAARLAEKALAAEAKAAADAADLARRSERMARERVAAARTRAGELKQRLKRVGSRAVGSSERAGGERAGDELTGGAD